MRFKALLAGALLCFAGAPVSAATYIGTLKQGQNALGFASVYGRSIRANIIFSEPVDVIVGRYYLLYEGMYDRKTGSLTYRSEDRDEVFAETQTTRVQAKWIGFQRTYFRNIIASRIALHNSIELSVKANEGTSYIAMINGSGVPEPSTWALMILGIGLAGVALRKRQAALTVV